MRLNYDKNEALDYTQSLISKKRKSGIHSDSYHYDASEITFAEARSKLEEKIKMRKSVARAKRGSVKDIGHLKVTPQMFDDLKFCSSGIARAERLIPEIFSLTIKELREKYKKELSILRGEFCTEYRTVVSKLSASACA